MLVNKHMCRLMNGSLIKEIKRSYISMRYNIPIVVMFIYLT